MNRRAFLLSSICSLATTPVLAAPRRRPRPPKPPQPPVQGTYWSTDHETGNLSDWSLGNGGGNFSDSGNNQNLEVLTTQAQKYAGNWSALCKIKKANNFQIGTRLMRWRDSAGNVLPPEAYYSTWMYVPHAYRTTADWWIVFQFKSQRRDNSGSDPTITGNLSGNGADYEFYFWDHINQRSYDAGVVLRPARWTHLEAWFRWDRTNGAVKFWQDGALRIDRGGLTTKIRNDDNWQVWGVGNYTSDIQGHPDGNGIAEVYFDSCAITSARKGP
jgi:hypothetical protein